VRARRRIATNLTADERRVLEAFYCGRLSAGQLSKALHRARTAPAPAPVAAAPAPSPAPAPAAAEPAPLPVAA
jgi:hypothetical protein